MKTQPKTGLIVSLLTIALASAVSTTASELSDREIHGTYVGFSPLAASQGATFEESAARFHLDAKGIILSETIASHGVNFEFHVYHSPRWVFPVTGWGLDGCLGLKQHENSKLAKLIFCFPPKIQEPYDAIMILGEGMPAVLGVFMREGKGSDLLRKLHAEEYKPGQPKTLMPDLIPLDMDYARQTMKTGTYSSKLSVLEKAAHGLWTGTNEEIRERLTVIARGLNDPDPFIQRDTLSFMNLGGKVSSAVPMILNILSRYKSLRPYVLEEALHTAGGFLSQTHRFNQTVAMLENRYGTTDVGTIHAMTNGLIIPEDFEALKDIAWWSSLNSENIYTREQQSALRNATAMITDDSTTPEKTRKAGRELLADYPMPRKNYRPLKNLLIQAP